MVLASETNLTIQEELQKLAHFGEQLLQELKLLNKKLSVENLNKSKKSSPAINRSIRLLEKQIRQKSGKLAQVKNFTEILTKLATPNRSDAESENVKELVNELVRDIDALIVQNDVDDLTTQADELVDNNISVQQEMNDHQQWSNQNFGQSDEDPENSSWNFNLKAAAGVGLAIVAAVLFVLKK